MAYNYLRIYNDYNNNFDENILNWKIYDNNIESELIVKFERKI